ncbi:MAG: hypothetical protein ACRCT8_10670 [Lacipirellulaceae bacterium]
MKRLLVTALAVMATTTANAQPVIDGSVTGDTAFYGAALSTQNTRTQFGDNNNPDPWRTTNGGSEINQVFGRVSGGRLHVMITGNLESNFNKIEVFIDSVAGGVNTLTGTALPTSVDAFCCGQTDPTVPITGGALQRMDGLTFDTGFNADRYLTFSNGQENVNARDTGGGAIDPNEARQNFWGFSAHYADLTQGAAGQVVRAGVQYSPQGKPNVLRNPMDYNSDGVVNAADYTVWRDNLGATGIAPPGDGNGKDGVTQVDYDNWVTNYGANASLTGPEFLASGDFNSSAQVARNVALPGLAQGQLVDRSYALGAGGCTNDDGDGCAAEELEFVLRPASDETNNGSNHRFFENTIDLRMAIDNSGITGVKGSGSTATDPDPFAIVPGEDDLATSTTGIEFSIPLSALGSPTGDIKLLAFVNGGGHDFLANQLSGAGNLGDVGLGLGRGNLGRALFADVFGPALFTMNDIPGNQFVTIAGSGSTSIPEPTALLLASLSLMAAGGVRRR